ncbi:protein kinase [Haliangium sp. UPWRP_2]|uniref:protein kinase domain-containing protein n=1 Tax=Haliangium sp. UPWRP_2 TaxID=1931276 RepID=UPI000D0D17B4|nr:protein kinase [Haliangium sp. UPWRP_2]PSM31083.1 hypothetical protein BVG81_007210 [Haliangium sp. UPWRP_2]
MAGCLAENTIVAFIGGQLSSDEHSQALSHVTGCRDCGSLVAELAKAQGVESGRALEAPEPAVGLVDDWEPPQSFAGFQIRRLVGQGQMGRVYEAYETALRRTVAIKVLRPRTVNESLEGRFNNEAIAIARVQHPGVVKVFQRGSVEGHPYIVSEFVQGKSLNLMALPLPWQKAQQIGLALAGALGAAHNAGVLHRDIKPANAMITDSGELKLLDFGLAKLLDCAANAGEREPALSAGQADGNDLLVTRLGTLIGTPRYLAPELWSGDGATPRSDVYSLGALLFELCTGRPLHPEAELQLLKTAAQKRDAESLLKLVPGIDPHFAEAVARSLRREQAERFENGAAFAAALAVQRKPLWRRYWTAAAIVALVIATAAALLREKGTGPKPAVAVIDFVDIASGAPHPEVARALTDAIERELSESGSIQLVATPSDPNLPSSARPQAGLGDPIWLETLRRRHGAAYALTGHYRLVGEPGQRTLEVSYTLVDTLSSDPVLADTERAAEHDILRLARRVGGRLRGHFGLAKGIFQGTDAHGSLPKDPKALGLYIQGQTSIRANRYDDARKFLEHAARIEKNNATIHRTLAEAFQGMGLEAEQQREADNAHRLAMENKASAEERKETEAYAHWAHHRFDEAAQRYRELSQEFPKAPEYAVLWSEMLFSAGKPRDALIAIDEITKRSAALATEPLIFDLRGRVQMSQGENKAALESFNRALAGFLERGHRYWIAMEQTHQAQALIADNRPRDSLEILQKCMPVMRDIGALRDLGWQLNTQVRALSALDELDGAIAACEEEAKLWEDTSSDRLRYETLFRLINLLLQVRRCPQAAEYLQPASKLAVALDGQAGREMASRLRQKIAKQCGTISFVDN